MEGISGWHHSDNPLGPLYFCCGSYDDESGKRMMQKDIDDAIGILGMMLITFMVLCAIPILGMMIQGIVSLII